ncbi:MAG: class I SAM-dependent methyltransferase, partial [candidate division Zixibacteria bacterium]|nr:class I SAM-dependent methyltransferase [candidate division Zixibacteria bacterium]NIW45022.1 methyltransferase domain-containing protein [Gammaproteobacteria bacterium]NIX56243.1 methyltransferase domain-containing protein [candidate division Zixibacteria bacterium]
MADIRELNLKPGSLDGAVARWVLMFVPDINTVIQTVASALKSNGVFAVMDYFHFRSMS